MTTPAPEPGPYAPGSPSPLPDLGGAQAYPAPYQPPPKPRKTGPKILTFSGVAVLVAGVIAGIVGIAGAAGGIADLVPTDLVTAEGAAGSDALAVGPTTEPLAFDVADEGAYLVFEVSQNSSAVVPVSAVTVDGPTGPVSVEPSTESGQLSSNGWSVFPVGVLVPVESGAHTLSVEPDAAADGVSLAVSAPIDAESFAGLGGSGIAILLGFLAGGLGFLILIAGIIWWAVAKK